MSESKTLFVQVLPHRPPPYPGECLSGYLVRLAEANGFAIFWDLANDLFPSWDTAKQLPLLRWEYPLDNWGRIPLRTQLSPAQLHAMSVTPLLEKFRPLVILKRPGHLSPGHWLHGVVRPNLDVCPQCLEEQPYVRLLWRLMPVQVCLTHRCWLQGQCVQCGHTLRAMSPTQPHLRCADCGMDLRRLPVAPAPPDLVKTQDRRQADLQFLLNPEVSLIKPVGTETMTIGSNSSKMIGLKFRYLRERAGLSPDVVAHQMGVTRAMIGMLECGHCAPIALYLSYLDALSWSWLDLADLQISPQFKLHKEPTHLPLRVCPNPECPNHTAPSGNVTQREDLPERRIARFRCMRCGWHFTRSYDGQLITTQSCVRTRPIRSRAMRQPQAEVNRLLELGRQGMANRFIARRLGWTVNTVRRYWVVLGVEEEIHQVQVERRIREEQERKATMQMRVEEVLQSLLRHDEEITFKWVRQETHYRMDQLLRCPGLVDHIRTVARTHNEHVRQCREDILLKQLMDTFAELKQRGKFLTILAITARVGLIPPLLAATHPKVYATVRQVVNEHNARLKEICRQEQCKQINEAAARLVARHVRLTYVGILKEAGVHRNRKEADLVIRELLDHWIGDPLTRG